MTHVISIEQVDIELDYAEIWDNISDSVEDAAREAVNDYAWDAVASDVEQYVSDALSGTSSNTDAVDMIQPLLEEYVERQRDSAGLCKFGKLMEEAILITIERAAQTRIEIRKGITHEISN